VCSSLAAYVRLQSSVANTISEKAIRFRHLDYDPDRAQKLISSSMSRHLSTCNISSKSMYAFLSNLANRQTGRQTDKQTRAKTCTSSFVGGNYDSVLVKTPAQALTASLVQPGSHFTHLQRPSSPLSGTTWVIQHQNSQKH